ncbi:uncharacterized protein EV154DRAFT_523147 [Mucor mucedo]|uniref:uncharacterized protein n=1 Tax=Mucor mucedo TaxID=29922 RepID=UPI00221EFD41|nr:uncharacterized protein EV154DRAFT_523147 [Mucor mucedo]KAI7882123.1 hypothetical protein EV154DRAFT_523147 [Mucor mucedo]
MLNYVRAITGICLLVPFAICSIPYTFYNRSLEKIRNSRKSFHLLQKNKNQHKRKSRKQKKKKKSEANHIKNTTKYSKYTAKNKNMIKTLSINTNIVQITKNVTRDGKDTRYITTLSDPLPTSTKVLAPIPTVPIKAIPTAVGHDTAYRRLSTATSIHTILSIQSESIRHPSVTPAADHGAGLPENHFHTKEGYKSLTTTHKLAIGLGVGFGCLAILGLVVLFLQNYKKKQRISHHSPTDATSNFFSAEKPSSLTSSNDISTRWRPNSFLGVVASVVARLPASRSSGSVAGMASDASEPGSLNVTAPLRPSALSQTHINEAI